MGPKAGRKTPELEKPNPDLGRGGEARLRQGLLLESPFPSRFIVSDRSSPSRVRFAASRPGPLRADPKDVLFTREKGRFEPWGAEGESLVR